MASAKGGTIRPLEDKPRKHCRRWQLRVRTGLNPRTGKYGERTRNVRGTWSEACAELALFADEVKSQGPTKPRKVTVEQLIEDHVSMQLAVGQIKESSAKVKRYQSSSLCRHIGKMPVAKLTAKMVLDAYAAMRSGDTPTGKPSSGTTLRHIHSTLNGALEYAVTEGIVPSNPLSLVPWPTSDTKERKPPTDEQVGAMIAALDPSDGRHAAAALGALGGLRVGETVRERWEHVDLDTMVIHVDGTKNSASRADIPMCRELADWLAARKRAQRQQMMEAGLVQGDGTYIVTNGLGEPLALHNIEDWWKTFRKSAGMGAFRFHDLRHWRASSYARNGVNPKTIQLLMRHSSIDTTNNIYTHADLTDMKRAIRDLDRAETEPE